MDNQGSSLFKDAVINDDTNDNDVHENHDNCDDDEDANGKHSAYF